jgi:hypothetical protein
MPVPSSARFLHDFESDAVEREHLVRRSALNRLLGHPEHDAALLALGDRPCARVFHLEQPARAVIAHAGEQDTEGIRSRALGRRPEQHVDGRPMAGHGRPLPDRCPILPADALQQHVKIARRDQDVPRRNEIAIRGFLDRHCAQAVEPPGKGCGKFLGHVLDNNDAGGFGRQLHEDIPQRFGAAGRCSDADDAVRHVRRRALGPDRRQDDIGRKLLLHPYRRDPALPGRHAGVRGGAQHVANPHAGFLQELGGVDARLRHDIDRAGLERLDRGVRTRLGQRRADHDGNGPLRHDLARERQPVHARHFDVQQNHVGNLPPDLLGGDVGVCCGRHDFEIGLGRNDVAERLTYRGGVVDDENAQLSAVERSIYRAHLRVSHDCLTGAGIRREPTGVAAG